MSLKVIRYKHYGCTIDGGYETPDVKDLFYWSFFELNNGEIIKSPPMGRYDLGALRGPA